MRNPEYQNIMLPSFIFLERKKYIDQRDSYLLIKLSSSEKETYYRAWNIRMIKMWLLSSFGTFYTSYIKIYNFFSHKIIISFVCQWSPQSNMFLWLSADQVHSLIPQGFKLQGVRTKRSHLSFYSQNQVGCLAQSRCK